MSELIQDTRSKAIRITSIVRKEIKTLMSDRAAITILFLVPIVLLVILGTSAPTLTGVTVWIVDLDNTPESQAFIETMKSSQNINIYATGDKAPIAPELGQSEDEAWDYVSYELALETVGTTYLDAAIILPEGFTESLSVNGTTKIQVYYDSIDFLNLFIAQTMIMLGITDVQLENLILESDVFAIPDIRPEEYSQFTEVDTLTIAAPQALPLMLFFSIQMIATQCIVGDVPLKRMLNTSLRREEVVTGKIIAYTILAIFQVIISILLCQIFNLRIYSLWIDLFFVLLLNSICAICIGVFISTISKSRLQASQLFLLVFFMMFVNMIYTRNPFFLRLTPLEQAKNGYLLLASRGMDLVEVLPEIGNMLFTMVFFYLITIVFIKYIKKEFV